MAHEVDLAEYDRLRQEIDNRTQIANGLVGVQLTALGAGVAVFQSLPEVVVGLAVVSAFLWMLWVDHAGQIWKLAAYIAIDVAPRLRRDNPGALGWEWFVRRLDGGGQAARNALRLPAGAGLVVPKTSSVGFYISALFGGSPLILLTVGLIGAIGDDDGHAQVVRIGAVVAALAFTGMAARAFWRFRALTAAIDQAIRFSHTADDAPAQGG